MEILTREMSDMNISLTEQTSFIRQFLGSTIKLGMSGVLYLEEDIAVLEPIDR